MSSETNIDLYRRRFLSGTATAAAGMALVPGVMLHEIAHAKPAEDAVSSDARWGMLIDSNKCAEGCNDCVQACNDEHGLTGFDRPATDAQWIRKVKLKDKQTGHTQTLPLLCQHCETPPCVDVCPTGASFKREDGIVLVDKHICIGCRYCMMACPYKARSFIHETLQDQMPHAPRGKGTVESCTFCVHRVDDDRTPACVEACMAENHNAMVFGDLNDPSSDISKQLKQHSTRQIRADLELNTGVRYRGI
uniref:Sulfur oxidation protein DsrO n=1 Tax=uncultured bacterium ws034A6 TaxID=1131824 RepID=I1X565_9BACT|nr:sulfur oxidation protein DsrO [uncultured bacterium ws034A6]